MKKVLEKGLDLTEKIKVEYNDLNTTNFSVAIDVIVIKQNDGIFKSSPFYLRFGKLDILKPKDQLIGLEINNLPIPDVYMKLDENGEAFFVEKPNLSTDFNHFNTSLSESEVKFVVGDEFEYCYNHKSSVDNTLDDEYKIPKLNLKSTISLNSKFNASETNAENSKPAYVPEKPCLLKKSIKSLGNIVESLNQSNDKKETIKNSLISSFQKISSSNPIFLSPTTDPQNNVYFKSKIPTQDQIAKFNLKIGENKVKYTIAGIKGDSKVVIGYIFLWNSTEKIVITDIDGTITKTALRGQILSIIGKNWYHDNIVDLLSSIAENGYKIIYLSARPFFECDITRNVIKTLNQNQKLMPPGPLIVNPVNFLNAFQVEIIDKTPDEFKISFLNEVKFLFDGINPFYAGFGDKITDVNTYASIGIKKSLIFIVNEFGYVNFDPKLKDQLTYKAIVENINKFFPFYF